MKSVFVDAQVARALKREALSGEVLGELLIESGDGSLANGLALSQSFGTNAIVMIFENVEPESLRAMTTKSNAWEVWEEGFEARSTEEPVRMNHQLGGFFKTIQMPHDASVFAFFDDGKGLAIRTGFRKQSRIELDMNGLSGRMKVLKGVVSFQAYI